MAALAWEFRDDTDGGLFLTRSPSPPHDPYRFSLNSRMVDAVSGRKKTSGAGIASRDGRRLISPVDHGGFVR